MKPISYKRRRFPPDTIRLAVWLYFRFTTSLRDVEEMLAERGIDVSYETVRCWANKFGPAIAANIRCKRGRAASVWHLDEMVVRIGGKRMWWCQSDANSSPVDGFLPPNSPVQAMRFCHSVRAAERLRLYS